jgi:hypothetical protein
VRLEWGREALLTAQGSPKGKRNTQSESDHRLYSNSLKKSWKWVGVSAAERAVPSYLASAYSKATPARHYGINTIFFDGVFSLWTSFLHNVPFEMVL